jgi:enoyl-CoA hydratase/carnithine racemase
MKGRAMPTLTHDAEIWTLDLGDSENRFHPEWLTAAVRALDEVEQADGPRALLITAQGKFFSNGLDLDWVTANPTEFPAYVRSVQVLLARVLELSVPTVAAVQGHCFAAGAMLALACDFRVMRADRGFFCLPEVDINLPFTPGMSALIQARLVPQVAHEVMTTGQRYGGEDAQRLGIVDRAVGEPDVLPVATALAEPLAAKAGKTLATIKARLYAPALDALLTGDVVLG